MSWEKDNINNIEKIDPSYGKLLKMEDFVFF